MTDIRWGMIGCGAVTERKSGPAFYQTPGSRLAGLWNRSRAPAENYASRHPVERVFATLDDLLNNPEIDAIYIATPPASHLDLALRVAAAGKPCCVEKPIANSTSDARAMIAAFEDAGLPLFVSYYRRSLPRFLQVKSWIDAGHLGALTSVEWTLTRTPRPADDDLPWRLDPRQAPGGLFDDLACHGLDLFDHLLGPLDTVTDRTVEPASTERVPLRISADWTHANGVLGHGRWDFAAPERIDAVVLQGRNGSIRFSVFEDEPIIIETATLRECLDIPNPDPIQGPHVANLVRALNDGWTHPSTATSAVRTMRTSEWILTGQDPIQGAR